MRKGFRFCILYPFLALLPLLAQAQVTIEDNIKPDGSEFSTALFDPSVNKVILRYTSKGTKSVPLSLTYDTPAGSTIQVVVSSTSLNGKGPSGKWKLKFKKGSKYIETINGSSGSSGGGNSGGGGGGSAQCQLPTGVSTALVQLIIAQYRAATGVTLTEQEVCALFYGEDQPDPSPTPPLYSPSGNTLFAILNKNACKALKYEITIEVDLSKVDHSLFTNGAMVKLALNEYKAPSDTPAKLKAQGDGKISGSLILMKSVALFHETLRIVNWIKGGTVPKQIAKIKAGKYYPGQLLYFVAGINKFLNGQKASFEIFSDDDNSGFGGVCFTLARRDQTKDYTK